MRFEQCVDACFLPPAQISVSMNKDEPETPLRNLMKTQGAEKIRQALGSYVDFLKTGIENVQPSAFRLQNGV